MTRPDDSFHVYDTTLRDGAQREGVAYSVAGQAGGRRSARRARRGLHRGRLARRSAQGHRVLRAGPRPSSPRARAARRVRLHPQGRGRGPPGRRRSGPCWTRRRRSCAWWPSPTYATSSWRCARPYEENLAMVRDTVAFLVGEGRRVFVDCEHFFDGYAHDPDYGVTAAHDGVRGRRLGRRALRHQRRDAADPAARGRRRTSRRAAACASGIHCQDDTGCAVANTLAAVDAGATHVQCTANGYGERTGNADLFAVVGNLETEAGPAGAAAGQAGRHGAGRPTRSRSWRTCRRTPTSRTSGSARSRTRPACTPAP